MTPATTSLLELLSQLRGASRLGRTKILAQAATALRKLDADERRAVATQMAQRVAPHLVPHVDAMVDDRLTASQQQRLVDLVRRLDPDAVADVAEALLAGDHGTRSVPDLEAVAIDPEEPVDIVADLSLDLAQPEPMVLVEDLHDLPPSLDEPWAVTPEEPAPVAGVIQPGLAVLPERPRVVEPEDDPEMLQRLRAVPDGWRRRRLALDLVARAAVRPEQARDVVAMLGRGTDRAWVAGALLDARACSLDQIADLLPHHALDRLARRQSVG